MEMAATGQVLDALHNLVANLSNALTASDRATILRAHEQLRVLVVASERDEQLRRALAYEVRHLACGSEVLPPDQLMADLLNLQMALRDEYGVGSRLTNVCENALNYMAGQRLTEAALRDQLSRQGVTIDRLNDQLGHLQISARTALRFKAMLDVLAALLQVKPADVVATVQQRLCTASAKAGT